MEYGRWLEEHNRRINELKGAVSNHAGDGELRIIVDGVVGHYEDIFRIKGDAAKADVFHVLSGMWKTPAERCFLWLGGFRSSELLKVSVCVCVCHIMIYYITLLPFYLFASYFLFCYIDVDSKKARWECVVCEKT